MSKNLTNEQLEQLFAVITDIAMLKFEEKITAKPDDGIYYSLAQGLNMLSEEWQSSVISRETLETSERKFRNLFLNIGEGLVQTNGDGKIVNVNPSFCDLVGYSSGELIGMNLYSRIVEESYSNILTSNSEHALNGNNSSVEAQLRHKDGHTIWANISICPLTDEKGNVNGVFKIVSDITERKRLEKINRDAFDKLKKQEAELRNEHLKSLKFQSMLLSSQLNPHFIFNALNSIQYHVLELGVEKSLMFISEFANLMRLVLENSSHDLIPIEKEIEFLTNYLKLEQSRHQDKFNFEFICDDFVTDSKLYIAPMLLQPFVENAIIHGINQLTSGGEIKIELFKSSAEKLTCLISDNGNGIEEANQRNILKAGTRNINSSLINQSRIDILNLLDNEKYELSFDDLKNNKGQPCGTQVKLVFPIISEF